MGTAPDVCRHVVVVLCMEHCYDGMGHVPDFYDTHLDDGLVQLLSC